MRRKNKSKQTGWMNAEPLFKKVQEKKMDRVKMRKTNRRKIRKK